MKRLGRQIDMKYDFRYEVMNTKKAAMGEMYNLAKANLHPGEKIINFASGHPDTSVFQNEMIKKYINEAIDSNDKDFFQYGPHAGYLPLRESLKLFVNSKGIIFDNDNDDIIITYGSIEAFFLAVLAIINHGDSVIVDDPGYVNAIKCFRMLGADIRGVPIENDGPDLDRLEEEMKKGAKIYYTVPNFGNPSGVTTSLEKRKAIRSLSAKYNVLILEDDVYGRLRYRGEYIPALKELDKDGTVAYVGSMSKLIAPAMRIGFMIADREFIKRMVVLKGITSNGVNSILQCAVSKILEKENMDELIDELCKIYGEKLVCMEDAMDKYFPKGVKHSTPDGGMYIWVNMPGNIDIESFCRRASEMLVPITPGTGFCIDTPETCTGMRFNFVKESVDDIREGIKKVGKLMEEYLLID